MNLPENIKSQIAEFLNLEFGTNDILENELKYVGSSNDISYWILAKSEKEYWATVESYEDSYLIGITSIKPNFD